MPRGENRTRQYKANSFLVWRAFESCDWNATAQEIADEIGVHKETVLGICRKRGWRWVPEKEREYHPDCVDIYINRGSRK